MNPKGLKMSHISTIVCRQPQESTGTKTFALIVLVPIRLLIEADDVNLTRQTYTVAFINI